MFFLKFHDHFFLPKDCTSKAILFSSTVKNGIYIIYVFFLPNFYTILAIHMSPELWHHNFGHPH